MKNIAAVFAVMALLFAPSVSNARWGTEFTGESWTMDGKDFIKVINSYKAYAVVDGFSVAGKTTQGKLGGAAKFFVEGSSRFRLGGAAGFGMMPELSGKFSTWGYGINEGSNINNDVNFENKITYVPVDLYFKYNSKGGRFSLFGGGGADYVMAKTDIEYIDYDYGTNALEKLAFTQKKVMPHVQAGCELFLAKSISLNFSAKYLFSAVLDNLTGHVDVIGMSADKYRIIMGDRSPYGEELLLKKTSDPLVSGERPFKYDLSGLRANVGFRIYFN